MSSSVYLLWDPRNGDIRYIGRTNNPYKRYNEHNRSSTNLRCFDWKESLSRQGLHCEMTIVEEGLADDEIGEREHWWITYGRQQGWPITNRTDYDNGVHRPNGKGATMKHMEAMSFFLQRELLAALDKLAVKAHRNRSEEIRQLIVCEMERQGIEVEVTQDEVEVAE